LKDKDLFSITMDKDSKNGKIYYKEQLEDITDLLDKNDMTRKKLNLDYSKF
jgi:hypothetical protein